MPLQSSPASMSLSDIYQNINETDDVMPSGGTNVSYILYLKRWKMPRQLDQQVG